MRAINSYIKFVRFEERDAPPDDNSAIRRLKHEFYLHLNCRKYRGMKNFYAGDNSYWHFELVGNVLVVRANEKVITECRKILSLFKNVREESAAT